VAECCAPAVAGDGRLSPEVEVVGLPPNAGKGTNPMAAGVGRRTGAGQETKAASSPVSPHSLQTLIRRPPSHFTPRLLQDMTLLGMHLINEDTSTSLPRRASHAHSCACSLQQSHGLLHAQMTAERGAQLSLVQGSFTALRRRDALLYHDYMVVYSETSRTEEVALV
jgi:hypothetical protein